MSYFHGQSRTPTYLTWQCMKRRCLDKNFQGFAGYGAKGVTLYKPWLDFRTFLKDMGPRPSKSHTIDRINSKHGYSPLNCRWATPLEQNQNLKSNKLSKEKSLKIKKMYRAGFSQAQIARKYRVDQSTISDVVTGKSWN